MKDWTGNAEVFVNPEGSDSVNISFKIHNWSGIPTEEYVEKFFQQMCKAGAVERFAGKGRSTSVIRVEQQTYTVDIADNLPY